MGFCVSVTELLLFGLSLVKTADAHILSCSALPYSTRNVVLSLPVVPFSQAREFLRGRDCVLLTHL